MAPVLGAALLLAVLAVVAWAVHVFFVRPWRVTAFFAKQGIARAPNYSHVFGHALAMGPYLQANPIGDLAQFLRESVAKAVATPNFLWFLGPFPFIFVQDPEFTRDIFTTKAQCYTKSDPLVKRYFIEPLLRDGIFLTEGEIWKRKRALTAPAFHFKRLRNMVVHMVNAADAMIERVGAGGDIDIHEEFMRVSGDVVGRATFGSRFTTFLEGSSGQESLARVMTAMREVLEALRDRAGICFVPFLRTLPVSSMRRLKENSEVIHRLVADLIKDRLQAEAGRKDVEAHETRAQHDARDPADPDPEKIEDLLGLLMEARLQGKPGDPQSAEQLSFNELQIECVNFFGAGMETTSNAMSWILYHVLRHPDCLKACIAEVDSVLKGEAPTYESLRKLTYLEACIFEGIRLSPPASVVKFCVEDHDLRYKGRLVRIPKGTTILIHNDLLHYNPEYWGPDPKQFDPLRFLREGLGETSEPSAKRHPFAFLGFSAGPRKCMGMNFATLEMKTVLARLFQRFSVSLLPGQTIIPDACSRIPIHGIFVRLSSRQDSLNGKEPALGQPLSSYAISKPTGIIY